MSQSMPPVSGAFRRRSGPYVPVWLWRPASASLTNFVTSAFDVEAGDSDSVPRSTVAWISANGSLQRTEKSFQACWCCVATWT